MKILHTSDWHLGRLLYNQKRVDEFDQFLKWLVAFVQDQKIDAVLVAGDIFDTTTPSNTALELYYNFLSEVARTSCRHVVVVGGNHDSPSLLNAPKHLLKALHVHVVGEMCESAEEEVITLFDSSGKPEAIVCAVPFLRDRDVRTVALGESLEAKSKNLTDGIKRHYEEVATIALQRKKELGAVPIIGMGHLFAGGLVGSEGDGVRDLYVGTLAYVESSMFSDAYDYVALGHLHIAQKVGGADRIRYSGSPIPMGFNEANQKKKVVVVECDNANLKIDEHEVPVFRKLLRVKGSFVSIQDQIKKMVSAKEEAWLEVELTEGEMEPMLADTVNSLVENSALKVLITINRKLSERGLHTVDNVESLQQLEPKDVFERMMESNQFDEELKAELSLCFEEIMMQYHQGKV